MAAPLPPWATDERLIEEALFYYAANRWRYANCVGQKSVDPRLARIDPNEAVAVAQRCDELVSAWRKTKALTA